MNDDQLAVERDADEQIGEQTPVLKRITFLIDPTTGKKRPLLYKKQLGSLSDAYKVASFCVEHSDDDMQELATAVAKAICAMQASYNN